MSDGFEFCDALGPTKVIHVYEPAINLRGIQVVDNTAAGPSIRGLRMAAANRFFLVTLKLLQNKRNNSYVPLHRHCEGIAIIFSAPIWGLTKCAWPGSGMKSAPQAGAYTVQPE